MRKMDQFLSALRERGVPEECLKQMAEDKIDQDVVKFLEEDKLSMYIPRYGDRVFAKNWKELSSSESEDTEQRKRKLISNLREKMKLPSAASVTATTSSQSRFALCGNRNASKKTRKVEFGWLNYQDTVEPGPPPHSSPPSSSPPLVCPVKRPRNSRRPLSCSSPNSTSTLQSTPSFTTSDQPLTDTSIDDVVIIGHQTNMHYECVDGLADTLLYSPIQEEHLTVFVEEKENLDANLDAPWSVTIEQPSAALHNVDLEQSSSSTDFFANPENVVEEEVIVIRKAQCLMDMIEAFSNENILDANISIRRVLERGEVGSGIIRDCLTDFWDIFYTTKTSGTSYKIPNLHHKFKEREWTAVARILAFGWRRFQFLPVQLAPSIPFRGSVTHLFRQQSTGGFLQLHQHN
ncbi:hypothetical protein ABVT39_004183 [Epinephelus coioides]